MEILAYKHVTAIWHLFFFKMESISPRKKLYDLIFLSIRCLLAFIFISYGISKLFDRKFDR